MKGKFFRCHGCGKIIRISETNPARRKFVWTDTKTKVSRAYCYHCDELLIADQSLAKHK